MGDSAGHLGREPLRVLMTTDAVGGVWQYSIDLSAGLAERGAQITLVTLGPRPSSEQRKQARQVPRLALIETDFALEWMSEPWAGVDASGVWLIELASAVQPQVVHLNGYSHAALDWKQPVVAIAHSCVYSWWRAVHQCAPGADWLEYQRRVACGLQHADAVVAPSRWMAAELERNYGLARGRAEIIHNFSRTQFGMREKQPIILAAGRRWDKGKNIAMLDAIAPELHGEIRIAGSSTTGGAAFSHSELMEQMNGAAIFAHPALYEPFGLAILEAARARCCLVLSDIPSLRELWDGAAIFVDPRNESAWIRELNSLVR
ncbi:MAG: glycosyltransferase, partial [Acidobacteriaceae bacterium]|nr:glycosyltransferase [Acidobacteriaceae bacterium]